MEYLARIKGFKKIQEKPVKMTKRFMHIFVLLILFACTPIYNQIEIVFWYGTNQTFGNTRNIEVLPIEIENIAK